MATIKKNTWGGVREGQGRKKKYDEPTTVIRVPLSLIPIIKNMLKRLERSAA
jgi:DNA polymerase V